MNETEFLTLKKHGRFGNCHPQYSNFGVQAVNWTSGNALIYNKNIKEFTNKTLVVKFDIFGIGTNEACESIMIYIKHCNGVLSADISTNSNLISAYYKLTDGVLDVSIIIPVEQYKNFAIIPIYEAVFSAFSYKKNVIKLINPTLGMGGFKEDITMSSTDFSSYNQITYKS